MIDRRMFVVGAAMWMGACAMRREPDLAPAFDGIRARLGRGGRLGVAAIDSGSGRRIGFDEHSRYAMASTFKLPLAGAILAEAERGALKLDEEVPFDPGEPLSHSPVVTANRARGRLPLRTLCEAIIEQSDNSAANLVLRKIGGPEGFTKWLRAAGDTVTRLDRWELELNSNLPGDERDTTSPHAMAETVRKLVLGETLNPTSRAFLTASMKRSVPGPDRLKAGLPAGWAFGHKTGTGARGAMNDVGIAWPPGRAPIVIASYTSGGDAEEGPRAAVHAAVAALVARAFA